MKNFIFKFRIILSLAALAFIVVSCEKEIDVNLRSVPSRVFIEGEVKQGQLARVRVGKTIDFDDNNGYPFLEGAVVKITDNKSVSEILNQDESGWYVAENLKGEIGHTYDLSVTYGDKSYTATSKMPPLVKLDSLTMTKIPIMKYGIPIIHFTDPQGEENQYYRCLVYVNGEQLPGMTELALSTEFQDGSPIHQFLPVRWNNNDVDPIHQGDDILIEFQCLDKGAFLFFKTLMDIENSLANPTTNIKGGALGYFSACTVDQMSMVAEW